MSHIFSFFFSTVICHKSDIYLTSNSLVNWNKLHVVSSLYHESKRCRFLSVYQHDNFFSMHFWRVVCWIDILCMSWLNIYSPSHCRSLMTSSECSRFEPRSTDLSFQWRTLINFVTPWSSFICVCAKNIHFCFFRFLQVFAGLTGFLSVRLIKIKNCQWLFPPYCLKHMAY